MVTDYLQEPDAALEAPQNTQSFINGFMKNRESALKKNKAIHKVSSEA